MDPFSEFLLSDQDEIPLNQLKQSKRQIKEDQHILVKVMLDEIKNFSSLFKSNDTLNKPQLTATGG